MFYFRFLLLALFFLIGTAFISESAPVYMAKRDSKFALVPCATALTFRWASRTARAITVPAACA